MTVNPLPRSYLAIWLPFLAEDSWRQAEACPAESLIVFVEKQANAMRLTALSRAAAAIGMTPGLTLADARARIPDLLVLDRDHSAEAQLLARIVAGCVRYTPMAATEPPDGAILDITGCTQAFDGERGIVIDLEARLRAGGVGVRMGLGDTPEAARARARFGKRIEADLAHLPIAALEASPESETALRRAGLRTIGDLACRPRRMLAARFGDVAIRLGRMLGEQDRRDDARTPAAPDHGLTPLR